MLVGEFACTYATLILHDDGIAITAEKIASLVISANATVESCWSSFFAKLAEKRNNEDLILNFRAGGGGAAIAGPVAAASMVVEHLLPQLLQLRRRRKKPRKRVMMIWDSVCWIRSSFPFNVLLLFLVLAGYSTPWSLIFLLFTDVFARKVKFLGSLINCSSLSFEYIYKII